MIFVKNCAILKKIIKFYAMFLYFGFQSFGERSSGGKMRKLQKAIALLLAVGITVSVAGCSTGTSSSSVSSASVSDTTNDDHTLYNSLDNFQLYDKNGTLLRSGRNATSEDKTMVSTGKYEATKIGLQILENGGNAIDAAAAIGFALGLVEPNASGLGGGGFMTIHMANGTNRFIDFESCAPASASSSMWTFDEASKQANQSSPNTHQEKNVQNLANHIGAKAVGIPGEVAGMLYALQKYGTQSSKVILDPVIQLANTGFTVTPTFAQELSDSKVRMDGYPEFGKLFLRSDGSAYETGDIFTNQEYADTLGLIEKNGVKGFYEGEVAEKIVNMVNIYGGNLTLEDLKNYKVKDTTPLVSSYRGYRILSAPSPYTGGAALTQTLKILENFNLSQIGEESSGEFSLFSKVFQVVNFDLQKYLQSASKTSSSSFQNLLSSNHAQDLADWITKNPNVQVTLPKSSVQVIETESNTSCYSVTDKMGNVVTVTQTVNDSFGSSICADGYGFMLNSVMGDFSTDSTSLNCVSSGKRPLSTMSPTIVLNQDGTPFLSFGIADRTQIPSLAAQILTKVIDHQKGLQEAVDSPRMNSSAIGNSKITYEDRFSDDVVQTLSGLGYQMTKSDSWDKNTGEFQGILFRLDGVLEGAADPRWDGKALG
jgi:gamma-glutamyltranspeptidase/glutathione hydrolase